MSKESRLRKVEERAKAFIEPDETVRAAVWGQTKIAPGSAVAGWMVLLGISKPFIVVLTQRNLYVMRAGIFTQTTSKAVQAKHALGTVVVEAGMLSIRIADHPTIFVHPFHRGRAKEIAAAAGPGGTPPGGGEGI